MKILVLGATGMLGNAMMRVLSEAVDFNVLGTMRSEAAKRFFAPEIASHLISGIDVADTNVLADIFHKHKPDVVINCIGLIKQLAQAEDPVEAITINSLLPQRLKKLCDAAHIRLIHFSTDCVFSGSRGGYSEDELPDARDLYGRSKLLGEVDGENVVTLRTSIIGHELVGAHSLIGWFLAQQGQCTGYKKAIFSGLPTPVMAAIVRDHVIPAPDLHGLYHVAAEPISKFDLLTLVADVYGKRIDIIPDESLVINRSLSADRFAGKTGFRAAPWRKLIEAMHSRYKASD
ncbi:dTDP-4-dehydrorhamnose reductase family protein [Herbaspirillum lusitanum]|uniref:dTDP-4-dehydrorhamnose reductase family protein n=1 Tax=Herbaspirillum lusitanum TaxID=213312 RepID=UPI0002F72F39|nr:SDR family oxidoreductase [Herbaspirillum lusitanum]